MRRHHQGEEELPKMNKIALLCAALAAIPALAAAAPGDEWYVTPEVGGISPDYRRNLENHDWLYGLAVGRELGQYLNLEANFNDARIGGGPDFTHLHTLAGSLDVLGILNREGLLAPYLSIGAGVLHNDLSGNPGSSHNDFMAEAGVGMFVNLWRNQSGTAGFSLRPDLKVRWDEPGGVNHRVDYLATMGFQYAFGGSPTSKPVPETPPPPPPPVAQPAPAPVAVPATPPDSDHDGVPDNIDKCPDTPAGVQVDAFGCPLKGSITLEGVTFEHNSSELTVASHPPLDEMADGLKKHTHLKVEIQGHTDSTGTPAYNLKLSQRRADAVRSYLVDSGVNSDQLVSRGYGQAQPVASNATAEGRAKNRRVVVFVVSNPGDVKVEGQGSAQ
jgi:OOP family OmpA-OmpF porin